MMDDDNTLWTNWSNWPTWRVRHRDFMGLPPLWHFHRVVAGRTDPDTFNYVKTHVIAVDGVDWMIADNAAKHRTSGYELVSQKKACIIRRGDVFNLAIKCKDRAFDLNRDRVTLTFEFGTNPSVVKGTKAVTEMMQRRDFSAPTITNSWETLFDRRLGQRIEVMVRVPVNAPVGLWRLSVETWQDGPTRRSHRRTYRTEEQFYILFNPYNEEDAVFMSHPAGREEYCLAEVGKVYGGSHNHVQGRPWVFGQMRDSVLPTVCHLLDKVTTRLRDSERADPVRVSRAVSALVNANDDNGVLMGRWDGNYSDGTPPFEWTGSVAILEQYMKDGGSKPVKYGQCWVFAAVATTICRALGIPCRCVTNYVSAHDTDGSLSVDKFFDVDGETLGTGANSRRSDSVWNFHVWNEVWMKRSDLPDGIYGGWQVIDATPQEQSDSLMQCGPASVEAVRRGELGIGYDADFVYAEVNADVHTFVSDEDSEWGFRMSETNTSQVGKILITKAIGYMSDDVEEDYETITDQYKAKEGSLSERLTFMKALRHAANTEALQSYPGMKNQDVYFQMIDLDTGIYGQPFNVSLFLHNQSREERTLRITMVTNSMFYTGLKAHPVKQGEGEFILQPYERETLTMTVPPDEYMPHTVEYCHFANRFLAKVKETGQLWTGEDNFILEKPKLEVRAVPDTPRVNRESKIVVRLINPLSLDLTGCYFNVEAPGIVADTKHKFRTIRAKEKVDFEVEVTPWKSGQSVIVATFNSHELYNLTGTRKVSVIA